MDAELAYFLRVRRNATQQGIAARAGISQPQISRIERGEYEPTRAEARRLAAALALGSPIEGEDEPFYVLAERTPLNLRPLRTSDGRIGLFRDPLYAQTAADLLNGAGLAVTIVPTWTAAMYAEVMRHKGQAVEEDDVFRVDRADGERANAKASATHAMAVLAAVDDEPGSGPDRASELAARMLKGAQGQRPTPDGANA